MVIMKTLEEIKKEIKERMPKKMKKSKKIKSKAGEKFMATIKKLQAERNRAILAQRKERLRWIKEIEKRRASEAQAAEILAMQQRVAYEAPDPYLDMPEAPHQPLVDTQEQVDDYGRELSPAGGIVRGVRYGLNKLGATASNIMRRMNMNRQQPAIYQAPGTSIPVNRWHNQGAPNIIDTNRRSMLTPVGKIYTPSPFLNPSPSLPLLQENIIQPTKLNFWRA